MFFITPLKHNSTLSKETRVMTSAPHEVYPHH